MQSVSLKAAMGDKKKKNGLIFFALLNAGVREPKKLAEKASL